MEPSENIQDRCSIVARTFVAGYIGALLFGPPDKGLIYTTSGYSLVVLFLLTATIPGLIAGRRTGLYAGAITFLLMSLSCFIPGFAEYGSFDVNDIIPITLCCLVVALIGGLFGLIGGFISRWLELDNQLLKYKYWKQFALIGLVLWAGGNWVAYKTMNTDLLKHEYHSSIQVVPGAVYPVGVFTFGDYQNDYAWTDPTGLVIISKSYGD